MNKTPRSFNLSAVRSLGFILASLCSWTAVPISAAENDHAAQQELAAVGDAIAVIQAWLADAKSQQSDELDKLQQAELEVSALSQSVASTEETLSETESEIQSLERDSERIAREKAAQSKVLEQVIRATYMTGNQSAIELLLNQEDMSKSARMLHYHRLLTQAQLDGIGRFQETLDEYDRVNDLLTAKAADLEERRQSLKNSLQSLDESKRERELALSELHSEIASRSSELEQLQIDQEQLQELVEEIGRAVADIPEAMQRSPFAQQLGKLPMPVSGEIIDRFGTRYGEGDLTRQGITIDVSEGTPVQAIHPGRVVFSDWLRGPGLLVIVDHGQGYMSLYGSNQALAKQAGDWVAAGDIVATSGVTNELPGERGITSARPSMYFEIRHHGEAQDPARWFSELK